MGFFKSLFGGKEETPEEKKEREEARDFDVLKTNGLQALRTGKWDYAVKCLTMALEIKEDLETHDYLSRAYLNGGQLREAFAQLRILAEAQPDNLQVLITMAHVALMMEDFNLVNETCEKALAIDNDNAEVVYIYARAAQAQQDLVNAVALFTKATILSPDFNSAYLERGGILLGMGDIEGAEEDADHLLEVAPDTEEVLMLKARVLMAQQRTAEAISFFDRVIEVNPFHATAFLERGAAHQALGDSTAAEEDLKQALEIDPNALNGISGSFSNNQKQCPNS